MKTILRIARTELSTLFYSPIAWLILTVFAFQTSLQYTTLLGNWEAAQQLGNKLSDLTFNIFTSERYGGLFPQVQSKLFLYIPLLTMGLMSREISSGSIKLLLSSPIRISQIIFGKFFAMMAYGLLLIAILIVVIITGAISIQNLDVHSLISGLLGIYLVICAYSAIGLFMSSITSYQVVAAISTLVTLAALGYVGTLWQDINILREITYFLSISGRATQMISGLISTKDLLYFILVSGMFLGFSILKMQAARASNPGYIAAGRYAILTIVVLFIGYLTSIPTLIGYYDMTATKSRTLTVASQNIVKQIKHPLHITTYVNLLDRNAHSSLPSNQMANIAMFGMYTRFLPNTKFNFVYFYDVTKNEKLYKMNPGLSTKSLAKKIAKSNQVDFKIFKSPEQIRKIIDLRPEENRMVRQLTLDGKQTFLRLFDDMQRQPSEAEISAALKRLVIKVPKVGFIIGHQERDIDRNGDRDYKLVATDKTFRYSMPNLGFDVEKFDLETSQIPPDLDILVIADPQIPFSPVAQKRLFKYLEDGKNMLIAGEPARHDVLTPIFQQIGVVMEEGTLVQESKDYAPDFLLGKLGAQSTKISKYYDVMRQGDAFLSLQGTAAFLTTPTGGYKATPIVSLESKLTYRAALPLDLEDRDRKFNQSAGDQRSLGSPAIALQRSIHGRDQRLIVLGDADIMSNAEILRTKPKTSNLQFVTQLFSWLSKESFPIDTSRPMPTDNLIKISASGIGKLKLVLLGILPICLLAAGSILLISRKRK